MAELVTGHALGWPQYGRRKSVPVIRRDNELGDGNQLNVAVDQRPVSEGQNEVTSIKSVAIRSVVTELACGPNAWHSQ